MGQRFGDLHYQVSEYMAKSIEPKMVSGSVPHASLQSILGAIMLYRAKNSEAGNKLPILFKAVEVLDNALEVFDSEKHFIEYAGAKTNLAFVYQELGMSLCCRINRQYIMDAIAMHRQAIEVHQEKGSQVQIAKYRLNLGIALSILAVDTEDEKMFLESLENFDAAILCLEEFGTSEEVAQSHSDAGIARLEFGKRKHGNSGRILLEDSIKHEARAILTFKKDSHSRLWAICQLNSAAAEEALADHRTTTITRPHLEAALAHVEAALTVLDPKRMGYNFEKATRLRGRLQERLNTLPQV